MADFDAIVVGSGCAGPIAAYELAKASKSVLVIERGNFAGSKNMSGGRLYSHSIKKVFPEFEAEAPIERRIIRERISLMSTDANVTLDFSSEKAKTEGRESYSVLRSKFDQWLAQKAEEAGADFIYGIGVDEIVKDDTGKVIGVRAGDDLLTAEVVILCDGANSLLADQAVGFTRPKATEMAVGVKQVLALPANEITSRVLAETDEDGAAWLFVGDVTKGAFGGGFMYTNKDSISLGIVAGIDAVANGNCSICQMLEDFKARPDIKALIRGAEVVEHSGHMVPEGGLKAMPPVVGDGVILAGDSAMMCVNLGYVVRGMDYAIEAGRLAGIAAVQAIDKGDTSATGLECYKSMLEESFVMADMNSFRELPEFLAHFERMYQVYPGLAGEILDEMFIVDGKPVRHVKQAAMPHVKKVGLFNILRDVRGALKAL